MSLSNSEQSRQDQAPKKLPIQKAKNQNQFGRSPYDSTLYFKEINNKNAQLICFDLQFLMFATGSFTSRPISDDRLAERTELSVQQIERARRVLAQSQLVEVQQAFSGQGKRVVGTYVYRFRTPDEIEGRVLAPDFAKSDLDENQTQIAPETSRYSSPKVVEEGARNQQQIQPDTGTKNYQKLVEKNEGRIGGKPDVDKVSAVDDLNRLDINTRTFTTQTTKGVVELINLEWKNSRGEPAQIGMIDQLVKSIQGKSAGISEAEIVQLCQTVFERDGEGETPAWFYKNKGAYLVDDLLNDRQEKLKEQQKKEDTKQRRQQHQELKSEAADTPASVDEIINRAGKGPEAKPRPGKRPKRPTSQLRKDQRVSQLENRNRVNENEFQTSLTENDAQAVTASVNQTMAALGLQRESDQQW